MKELIVALGLGLLVIDAGVDQTSKASDATAVSPAITATANLIDANGRGMGRARLRQAPHGVLLEVVFENATTGGHGLHLHEVGRCERPGFASAGGHFNPTGRQHGYLNARGPHAGDLPNIEVPSTGRLSVEYFVADVTLEPGAKSLLDQNGSSLVVHAGKDDHASDPAGVSGDRLACGEIIPAETR